MLKIIDEVDKPFKACIDVCGDTGAFRFLQLPKTTTLGDAISKAVHEAEHFRQYRNFVGTLPLGWKSKRGIKFARKADIKNGGSAKFVEYLERGAHFQQVRLAYRLSKKSPYPGSEIYAPSGLHPGWALDSRGFAEYFGNNYFEGNYLSSLHD